MRRSKTDSDQRLQYIEVQSSEVELKQEEATKSFGVLDMCKERKGKACDYYTI